MTDQELRDKVEKEAGEIVSHYVFGNRNQLLLSISETLFRYAKENEEERL